jgi:peroxiredoxin Q/BCP
VIGISVDSEAKNAAMARSLELRFPVLSDPQRIVCRRYGVMIPVIRLANRVTFVIDKHGTIRSIQRGAAAMQPENAYVSCSILRK